MLAFLAITRTAAPTACSERGGGPAGGPWLSIPDAGWEASDPLAPLLAMRRLVERSNACALPGVAIKYDNFIPVMWHAVARGFVKHEHAVFVADGLRLGFTAGFDSSKMFGHRWFNNYPTATDDSAVPAVVDATQKRVAAGKTLDLGLWDSAVAAAIKFWCKCSAIFPMGAVAKALEPDALRPTDDHTRTGFNAATDLSLLRHSVNAYHEIAAFLQRDYFMRVSDVDAAFPMLPLHPDVWPFMFFRYFSSSVPGRVRHLYCHLTGDFGTAGMPGCFKIFFVDVVLNMARAALVLTLPMAIYVDDCSLIGCDEEQVNAEMLAFHAWALTVCGVAFKALKDRVAAKRQLMLGFWWDSTTLTRTLEERKLLSYVDALARWSAQPTLSLREMQSIAGKMQRAIMTFPPGAACLLLGLFTLISGLRLPWHRRRVGRQVRTDMKWAEWLLRLNLGQGHYAYSLFSTAAVVESDASKSSNYTGGGYVSACGMYNFWKYGSRAARKLIDFLEGDTVVVACTEMKAMWHRKLVPFGIDNMTFQRSAAKGRSSVERLNVLTRESCLLTATSR